MAPGMRIRHTPHGNDQVYPPVKYRIDLHFKWHLFPHHLPGYDYGKFPPQKILCQFFKDAIKNLSTVFPGSDSHPIRWIDHNQSGFHTTCPGRTIGCRKIKKISAQNGNRFLKSIFPYSIRQSLTCGFIGV